MRHPKSAAGALLAGTALLLAACGGGEADNAADNVVFDTDFGNLGDPSAVETMGNAVDPAVETNGTDAGTGPASDGTAPPPPAPDGQPAGPADVGGDMGGNAAGGTANGM